MNTSYIYHALGLQGYECTKNEYKGNKIISYLQKRGDTTRCSKCHSHNVIHNGFKEREYKTVNIGLKQQVLHVRINRLACKTCGCTAYEETKFASGKQRYTHRLARYVIELLHKMTISDVANHLCMSWDTIKDIHKTYLKHKFASIDIKKVKHIGIDEFAVHKGHVYMTIVLDMDSGAIIYVGDGKGIDALEGFWKKVKKQEVKTESVSTDLSSAFISAVMANIPNATYVFDHFHVQKLVNSALDEIRRVIWRVETDVDKRKVIKGARWLLLHNSEDIYDDAEKKKRLDNILEMNEPLYKAYVLKEYFRQIWTQINKVEGEKVFDDWVSQARNSKVPQLEKLANSIAGFKSGILAYYDVRTSNAKVEGTNNKIKVLKRMAYGYRDDDYFKLRLFNLHNDKITRFVG